MKKVTFLLVGILVFGVANFVKAQDDSDDSHTVGFTVPNFAVLDIEATGGKDITLDFNAPSGGWVGSLEAGTAFDFSAATNNDLWLNYTALTDKNGSNWNERSITVEVDQVISGIDLNLVVGSAQNGDGNLGEVVSNDPLTLTGTAQEVIGGIGSCFTENGTSNGHQLTYSLEASDYALIEAGSKSVTVTYTIVDNN